MRYFKQLHGTAVGTKFAPPYSILFMGYLEDRTLNSLAEKPVVWWRYIDIFMIWQHEGEKVVEFVKILNSCHPTIKFTTEESLDEVIITLYHFRLKLIKLIFVTCGWGLFCTNIILFIYLLVYCL